MWDIQAGGVNLPSLDRSFLPLMESKPTYLRSESWYESMPWSDASWNRRGRGLTAATIGQVMAGRLVTEFWKWAIGCGIEGSSH